MKERIIHKGITALVICQCLFILKGLTGYAGEASFVMAETPETLSIDMEGVDPFHAEPVYIDTDTGEVRTEQGESASLKEIFDISPSEEELLLSGDREENKDQLLSHLEENDLYYVRVAGEDELSVTFPFAYKRLLLFPEGRPLQHTYDAESVLYYAYADEYILDYPTEEAARDAWMLLKKDYGNDHVMPDLPITMQKNAYTETESISSSWGNDMMHLDQVRDRANVNTELQDTVTVAVLDSGIFPEHELFRERLRGGSVSFIEGSPWNEDGSGHGTHVAGIIADGTSDQVSILPLKVLGDNGTGGFAELMNGIYYAVEQKADVINMSLAINLNEYGMYWSDVSYLQLEKALQNAEKEGCLCVAAAGNDSSNMDTLAVYPAISESTITVSSINQYKKRASSSNYGESVDFAGPGDTITSAATTGASDYCQMSGTSMAAPHVSAACAMVSLYNKKVPNDEIKELLRSLAVDLGNTGKDKFFGEGLIVFGDGTVPVCTVASDDSPDSKTDPIAEDTGYSRGPASADSSSHSTSPISMKKASVKLSRTSFICDGQAKKPSVTVSYQGKALKKGQDYSLSFQSNKRVGVASVIIKGKGKYQGSVKKAFRINPKGTSLIKLKKGKKQFTLKWKKQTLQTSGYQIQYSTRKDFKKSTKTIIIQKVKSNSHTVKKLRSKKRYYARIRTFKKVNGKNYYSSWSKVRSVTSK